MGKDAGCATLNETRDSDESLVESLGRHSSATAHDTGAHRLSSDVDPRYVRVDASHGGIRVAVVPNADADCAERVADALHQRLDVTPFEWHWSLDLRDLGSFTLRFMDSLLALGRHLRLRGGALTIEGLRIDGALAPFSDLFRSRCAEHHITWATGNDDPN